MNAFKGLTDQETDDYLLSTGRTIKGVVKPLSPLEVMEYIQKMLDSGLTKNEIIEISPFGKDMWVNHYERFKQLIPEVQSLADWGATSLSTLGFTAVWHYYRFSDEDQRFLYKKALEKRLTRNHIKEIAQFYERGFGSIEECYEEVLTWEPVKKTYNLFIGTIKNIDLSKKLKNLKQTEKDLLLVKALKHYFDSSNLPDSRLLDSKYTLIFKPEQKNLYLQIRDKSFDKFITDFLHESLK